MFHKLANGLKVNLLRQFLHIFNWSVAERNVHDIFNASKTDTSIE